MNQENVALQKPKEENAASKMGNSASFREKNWKVSLELTRNLLMILEIKWETKLAGIIDLKVGKEVEAINVNKLLF